KPGSCPRCGTPSRGHSGSAATSDSRNLRSSAVRPDRCATLERERVVDKHQRCYARQQPSAVEKDLVHGFSTRRPSAERDTQRRSLPVGNWDGSSLPAQGRENSRPSCKQRRTALTLVERLSRSRSASARRL